MPRFRQHFVSISVNHKIYRTRSAYDILLYKMPPRLARASIAAATPKSGKNKNRKRNLDAYSIASHATKERRSVAPHRLGESLDDNPRQKRRKTADSDAEDDDDGSEEDESTPRRKGTGRGKGIGEEDGVEEGSDSEGNEWTLGGLAEGDEDSDLDSDEAFGESDEENGRFEGFTFRGSSNPKATKAHKRKKGPVDAEVEGDVDLDEADDAGSEEDESASDFGEDGVDLATMLDDEDEDMGDDGAADEGDSSDDEGSDSASDGESEEEEDADNDERLARLRDRVEAMDAQSASRTTAPEAGTATLSIDDLLADLDPAAKKQYAAALKTKKKSQAPKTLTAPLPKRQQDRINREAASSKAKEQLDRWRDTVIHNRRAEFLSFPLQDPERQDPIGKDKFDTQGVPQTELEQNIHRIMEESGMATKASQDEVEEGEAALMKAEELGTNHLPIEEVMRRRAELRRARALLFQEEIKAKRVAKIKSKAYRRVHRKERERQAEKERALLDPDGTGAYMDEGERESTDRKRAEERMSTKHRESKWAKSLKASGRAVWDEGARGSVNEQARRQEELRRRIAGDDINEDNDGSDVPSADSDGDVEDDAQALRQLARLEADGEGIGQKGVGGMKFMRAAEERKRAQNEEDIERLRKELAVMDGDEAESGEERQEEGLGRAIFGPNASAKTASAAPKKVKRAEMEEGSEDSDGEGAEGVKEAAVQTAQRVKQAAPAPPKSILKKTGAAASAPLAQGLLRDRRDTEAETAAAPPSAWLDVSKKSRKKERGANGGADVELSASGLGTTGPAQTTPAQPVSRPSKDNDNASASNTDGWTPVAHPAEDNADGSDTESSDPILTAAQQKADYHRRAFAGDDVHAAFALEKTAAADEEGEHEVSTHLPGWGSWAGAGLSKSVRKANARQRHNPLFKTKLPGGVKAEARKDKGMDKVIVSEKQDRKGKSYLAPMLPQGFEKREQYERSLRVPVGPEWTTKETFQRNTRPRVVVRPGTVVGAMEKPLV